MRYFCVDFVGSHISSSVALTLVSGARILAKEKLRQVKIGCKNCDLMVTIESQFNNVTIGEVSGVEFHAEYFHNGKGGKVVYLVHSNALSALESADDAYLRLPTTTVRRRKTVPQPSVN